MVIRELNYPLVTIGSLSFNNGLYVIKALDSVLTQTIQNFEMIIIDDASSDNSVELIEEWINQNSKQCTFIKHQKNLGICKSLNEIVSLAKGEYISFISDDIWAIDFIELCLAAFQLPEAENVSLVYAWNNIYYMNENRLAEGVNPINICYELNYPRTSLLFKNIGDDIYLMSPPYLTDILLWINPVIAISACLRLEKIKIVGGYNEKLPFEDYDMWFRLAKVTSFIFIKSVKATYIRHSENFTFNRKYDLRLGEILILINNYKYCNFADTRNYCNKSIINKVFSLTSFKKEKAPTYHIKTMFFLCFKISTISPYLFMILLFHMFISFYHSFKRMIEKIIKY